MLKTIADTYLNDMEEVFDMDTSKADALVQAQNKEEAAAIVQHAYESGDISEDSVVGWILSWFHE